MNLKPLQFYVDEYDHETVDLCRRREQECEKSFRPGQSDDQVEQNWRGLLFKLVMYFNVEMFAGERWENKKKIIGEWMERDRKSDTLLATSEAPEYVNCLTCRAKMNVVGKEIYDNASDGSDRVIFFFECPNHCKPRRAFFDNGEEWRPPQYVCPKCKGEMAKAILREKGKVVMTETCTRCGHVETTQFDTDDKEPAPDLDFMKDYRRFCLTDEQGQEYLKNKADQDIWRRADLMREREEEKKQLADRLAKIQKLTITEVERLLTIGLEREKYGQLHFSAPEIRRFFIVPFTIQNLDETRSERDAISKLQELMQVLLASTNWRLMSDGIYNQLGVLTGRLRGYDKEHELIELIEKKSKKAK